MTNISALRLRREYEIDLSGKLPDLSNGFTIEAWVCPAPIDRAVRLYPQPGYSGQPVRLKEGLYRTMAGDYLPQLGSACLPEAMEAVFFSEPDFHGECLAIRQDLPQAPDSLQKIGSVVVVDRSHRRQNHVVLFEQAGYQGKAEVLILPDFWRRADENGTKEKSTDKPPGLTQVGSAWVPPGVALEVTQLRRGESPASSSILSSHLAPDLSGGLPEDWPITLLPAQFVGIPPNDLLFLFEKPGYEGKRTLLSAKQGERSSPPWPVRSAIYVQAPDSLEGVIGFGPTTGNDSEREVQFFPVGTPMPSDSVRWHFWTPPDFRLVPIESEEIPEIIGSGLQECLGSTRYVVTRATATQPGKDASRMAEGVARVERPPDQPKTREGQAIYRSAEGKWERLIGSGQTWRKDVPGFRIVAIPKRHALFLFRRPIAEVETIADYEVLTDGIFDLSGLAWKPQAAIYTYAPHGTEGVVSLSHHEQVIPAGRVVQSSGNRSVWAPPGFELIRQKQEWGPGFHEHIAVFGHGVAQVVHSTLRGDLPTFDPAATHIRTRRDASPADDVLTFTTQQEPFRQQTLEPGVMEGDPYGYQMPPAFKSVRVPEGSLLRLYRDAGLGGPYVSLTGRHDDLSDLPWTPRSFAFGEAPYGKDGIIYTERGRKSAAVPDGYKIGKKLDGKWYGPGYVHLGEPQDWWVISPQDAVPARIAPACAERSPTARIGIVAPMGGAIGLTIVRQPSDLRGGGDELRFGGMLLRPDRWYHLALTWDGTTFGQFLDGRQVQQADNLEKNINAAGPWVLGECFRGAISQVRVWKSVRKPDQIRDDRYPATTPSEAPALDLFAQGFDAWQAPPDAVVVSADLPQVPADSVLVKRMQQQVEAENAQKLQVAHQQATGQKILAHKQAQRKLALAREQARRDIHSKEMDFLCFVRGSDVVFSWPKSNQDPELWSFDSVYRVTDAAVVMDGKGQRCCYTTIDGRDWLVYERANLFEITTSLPNPPLSLTCDASGTNDLAKVSGQIYTGIYWVEANGAVCRTWYLIDILNWQERKPGDRQQLFDMPAPLGRPKAWDLALDTERQILYWTNGWELYRSSVNDSKPAEFEIVVPHVVSPFPVAVAVAPNGSLLWLDAEDEMVRMLPYDAWSQKFRTLIDLYPAPRPANGLVVSRLADDRKSGQEAAFVYWVAAERRTLEAPVLDTPGRYIDLYYDPRHPRWHGQHIDVVAVSEFTGAQWKDVGSVMTPDQVPASNDAAKHSRALSFGVGQNSDPSTADQRAQAPGPDDVLRFDPIRIDLKQGWTVSTDLIWEGSGSEPKAPICLYELATFEDEERIVCLIEPDEADSQSGIPTLYLRWNGDALTGETKVLSDHRLKINELHHVTWMLDRRGLVSTFIDGEKVAEERIALPDGVRVFEAHSLGAPDAAQTHLAIEWTQMTKRKRLKDLHEGIWGDDFVDPDPYLVNPDDPKRVFAGFQGRIVRFSAWNCTVPQAAHGWEHTPGPDPTWARSLVTVESKRRYLHAGRLDGQEPPVTLFAIDMDGGLNIETTLDQAHAELTLAHAQKAAAEQHATQIKAAALQDAHAKLEAATQNLADTQAKAAAAVAAAQAQADRDKADARTQKANADATAERDRVQGEQKGDQTRADGLKQAQDKETSAADDKRGRIADANRRYSDAQSRLDDAGG